MDRVSLVSFESNRTLTALPIAYAAIFLGNRKLTTLRSSYPFQTRFLSRSFLFFKGIVRQFGFGIVVLHFFLSVLDVKLLDALIYVRLVPFKLPRFSCNCNLGV